MQNDDASLIRTFAETGSEAAFAELVQRHVGLVYAAALRQLGGDAHRAQDATQAVFCELASKAVRLKRHRSIAGWLYNTSRFIAARSRRAEERRAAREAHSHMNKAAQDDSDLSWRDLETLIDDAMQDLSEKDREAVVLRFFQNRPLQAMGELLRVSEDGARMRVNRALEKLRAALARRGVKSSSAALSALLAAHAVVAPSSATVASLVGPAVALGTSATGTGLIFWQFMASAKLKGALAAIALASAGTTVFVQAQKQTALRGELDAARARLAQLERPVAPDAGLAETNEELARRQNERAELLRLRGEITVLRDQLAARRTNSTVTARAAEAAKSPAVTQAQREEINRSLALGKLNFTKAWGAAFHAYANANDGKMPSDFAEAAPYFPQLPPELNWTLGLTGPQDFEIMYRGSITDIEAPATIIIMREKQAFNTDDSGASRRTYLFADGHSEVHTAADGNFEPWEQKHLMPAR